MVESLPDIDPIVVGAGAVDSDYTGNIVKLLYSDDDFH